MKIRVGILERDSVYVSRLIRFFSTHYVDKVEISAFGSWDIFLEFIQQAKIDVLLADFKLIPEKIQLPKTMILAYLSGSSEGRTEDGIRVVRKYQRAEMLYREILGLYAELDRKTAFKEAEGMSCVYFFMGASGGVGATTMAVACAAKLASHGKKVLYLNLEANGVVFPFLKGEGSFTMSDVLYAVKSNRSNLALKLESMVRKSEEGVYFYEPFAVALDFYEMSENDLEEILNTITLYQSYDYVIADADSAGSRKRDLLMKYARQIFLVSDAREISAMKLKRILQEIRIRDENEDERILAKVRLIYNHCQHVPTEAKEEYRELVYGNMKELESSLPAYAVNKIAKSPFFDYLV